MQNCKSYIVSLKKVKRDEFTTPQNLKVITPENKYPMKKHYILPFIFTLIYLFSFSAQATVDTKLVGHWKNSSVSLKLKANGRYKYRLNSVVHFSGKWTSTKKNITLYYTLLGVKSNKKVRYQLDGNTLVIKKKGRPNVRLKKVK